MKRNRDEPMDFRIAIAGEKDLHGLVEMVLRLWPDCTYGEEYQNYRNILHAGKQKPGGLKINAGKWLPIRNPGTQ